MKSLSTLLVASALCLAQTAQVFAGQTSVALDITPQGSDTWLLSEITLDINASVNRLSEGSYELRGFCGKDSLFAPITLHGGEISIDGSDLRLTASPAGNDYSVSVYAANPPQGGQNNFWLNLRGKDNSYSVSDMWINLRLDDTDVWGTFDAQRYPPCLSAGLAAVAIVARDMQTPPPAQPKQDD